MSAILFGVIGLVTGIFGGVAALLTAAFCAVGWGLIGGWIGQHAVGQSALRVVILVVTLQATFLIGLALRTLAGR